MQFIALINSVTRSTTMSANWFILSLVAIVTTIIDSSITIKVL